MLLTNTHFIQDEQDNTCHRKSELSSIRTASFFLERPLNPLKIQKQIKTQPFFLRNRIIRFLN